MRIDEIKSVYFLGIGGIGMSALARYFLRQGAEISGYDRTETDLTRALEKEGMAIHYTESPELVPLHLDLVVWTPAIPADHTEFLMLRERRVPFKKRAEVLGLISRSRHTVAIGGTHGKTTTSSMAAHILRASGVDATAFVGGLAVNLGGNYAEGTSNWVVVEADEYDRSFLQLFPDVAVINSIDPDHLDIYGTPEAVRESFAQFAHQVKPGGWLLYKAGLPLHETGASIANMGRNVATFGIDQGNYAASNLRIENSLLYFDLKTPFRNYKGLKMRFPGRHNVENATAAIAAALLAGADPKRIPKAIAAFRGVRRRFDFIVRRPDAVFIDDYAHHPAELLATIEAARQLFPGKRITGVFQPHLYSRTRDFALEFAEALDQLDIPVLLELYPARELPIPGISSATIYDLMKNKNKTLISKINLIGFLRDNPAEILLTLGAGDIDALVKPIKKNLYKIKIEKKA